MNFFEIITQMDKHFPQTINRVQQIIEVANAKPLEIKSKPEVKKIILGRKKEGKNIFINTHILGDVAEICDTVGIIDNGELIRVDSPKNISSGYRDLEEAFVTIIEKRRGTLAH